MVHEVLEVKHEGKQMIWATVTEQNAIYIFNAKKFELFTRIALPENSPCFAICLHSLYVLVGSEDKIFIYGTRGDLIGQWIAHCGAIRHIISSNDKKLWTAAGHVVCMWELSLDGLLSLEKVKEISAHNNRITSLRLLQVPHMSNGGHFAIDEEIWSSSYDYNCLFWKSNNFQLYFEFPLPHPKELVRCFTQFHGRIFLGTSYRDKDEIKGNLFVFDFEPS